MLGTFKLLKWFCSIYSLAYLLRTYCVPSGYVPCPTSLDYTFCIYSIMYPPALAVCPVLFTVKTCLVSDISAGDGKTGKTFFYSVSAVTCVLPPCATCLPAVCPMPSLCVLMCFYQLRSQCSCYVSRYLRYLACSHMYLFCAHL
jgi:hypothetical protein